MRQVIETVESKPTMEGAGVKLNRVFGGMAQARRFDPFLLLDDFGSDNPDDYMAGFPWHPHRGIETVTAMLAGAVEHGDSLGNGGVIRAGDVQWMTAGNGIVHQEMPKRYDGRSRGFQLWVNLPAAHKMMMPRYRDVPKDTIPVASPRKGVAIRVIAGTMADTTGPVTDLVVDVAYGDVFQAAGITHTYAVNPAHTVLVYVTEGQATFGTATVAAGTLTHLGPGDTVPVQTGDAGVRFLLITGQPLNEPIAWRGPIVMNTPAELDLAFQEYEKGTFLKHTQDK